MPPSSNHAPWLQSAQHTIRLEAKAIGALEARIGPAFEQAVLQILEGTQRGGKLVFTGIGKSADVARKTVATLNSTGTAAAFLHAADALHGDLGLVSEGDVVMAVSKSGATAELIALLPMLQARDLNLMAMVGRPDSPVGRAAGVVLDVSVDQEACPYDLAPTTSSAAQLAMGDALAMALMEARGFSSDDFARHHPGGSLGRRLLLNVGDLLVPEHRVSVSPEAGLRDVVMAVSQGRVGATAVMEGTTLQGIVTDGDLRRALEREPDTWSSLRAADVMQTQPRCLTSATRAIEALDILESKRISQILVTDEGGAFLGFVHLHQLMDAGIR
ncbi:MAG: KpsF/GutQ family sugar-phosphate isomerase [Flavobacteriales bacterium]|nr:KpsF/GutQ family sugar-phosphate isomerase [Flavobacteriales bacterium]